MQLLVNAMRGSNMYNIRYAPTQGKQYEVLYLWQTEEKHDNSI